MRFLLILAAAGAAYGQEFEVATIRPTGPLNAQAIREGKMNVGLRTTGNQVDIGYVSLQNLVMMAYEVKPHQVQGPAWMMDQRYDIHGLMPEGADAKQVPAMLRALLKDRFKLVATKGSKDQDVYALEVAKDGHKMKDAPAPTPQAAEVKPAAGATTLEVSGRTVSVSQTPVAGGGVNLTIAGGATGGQKISMGPDGRMHVEIERLSMEQMADTLTTMLDLPVVNRTELRGEYQVALDLSMADLLQTASRTLGASAGAGLQAAMAARGGVEPGSDVFGAAQKLGLRLSKQKAPVEMVIVESAERNPSEN